MKLFLRINICFKNIYDHAITQKLHVRFLWNVSRWKVIQKSPPRGVLRKRRSEVCSKFTGERPRRSVTLIKLLGTFIGITLRHGCSPVNLLHIFRIPFSKSTSGRLLLVIRIILVKNLKCIKKEIPKIKLKHLESKRLNKKVRKAIQD